MIRLKKLKITSDSVTKTILGDFGVMADFGMPNDRFTTLITPILTSIMDSYVDLGYHYLPMADDDDITDEIYYRAIQMRMNCKIRDLLFPVFTSIGQDYTMLIPKTGGKTGSNHINERLTYGKVVEKEKHYNDESTGENSTAVIGFDVNENSPINAEFEILTPNYKSKSNTESQQDNRRNSEGNEENSETQSGTDSKLNDTTFSENNDNPDFYRIYLELLEKYNVYRLAEKVIKSVIYEYNMGL